LLNEAGDLMQQLLRGGSVLSRPADLLDSGYGLPQPADRHLLESRARQQYTSLLAMSDRIEEQLPMLFTARQRSELEGIGSNIQQLQQQLRRLHWEAGGLQLQPAGFPVQPSQLQQQLRRLHWEAGGLQLP